MNAAQPLASHLVVKPRPVTRAGSEEGLCELMAKDPASKFGKNVRNPPVARGTTTEAVTKRTVVARRVLTDEPQTVKEIIEKMEARGLYDLDSEKVLRVLHILHRREHAHMTKERCGTKTVTFWWLA